MLFIGIDTGTHTGLAVWDSDRRQFLNIQTLLIHRALNDVRFLAKRADVVVVIEDARQRKWLPRENSVREMKGRAMGAGSVRRDAAIWEDFCKDYGITFRMIPPQRGCTKLSPETFANLTGWKDRTSNHGRDAAMLVFGRTH